MTLEPRCFSSRVWWSGLSISCAVLWVACEPLPVLVASFLPIVLSIWALGQTVLGVEKRG